MSPEQRQRVVEETLRWERTPYHHRACVRGVGADCAMMPLGVYKAVGLVPLDAQPEPYSLQWHLHRGEERYLNFVERYATPVAVPLPGDLVVFKMARLYAHGAIVLAWPEVMHAHLPSGVVERASVEHGVLQGRAFKAYTLGEVA